MSTANQQQQDQDYFRNKGCGIFTLFMVVGGLLLLLPALIFIGGILSKGFTSPPDRGNYMLEQQKADTAAKANDTLVLPTR